MRALLRIAPVFNHEYDTGDYGPAYDRWDPRSQGFISRAEHIWPHTECPSAPPAAKRKRTRLVIPGGRSGLTCCAACAQILQMGLASQPELDGLDAAARGHLDDPRTVVISGFLFLAWGRKPLASRHRAGRLDVHHRSSRPRRDHRSVHGSPPQQRTLRGR